MSFLTRVNCIFVSTASMKRVETMLSCSRPRLFRMELETQQIAGHSYVRPPLVSAVHANCEFALRGSDSFGS